LEQCLNISKNLVLDFANDSIKRLSECLLAPEKGKRLRLYVGKLILIAVCLALQRRLSVISLTSINHGSPSCFI